MFIFKAYVRLVKEYREAAERERARQEEEKRKIREQKERCRRALDAAFEGRTDIFLALLEEVLNLVFIPYFQNYLIKNAIFI